MYSPDLCIFEKVEKAKALDIESLFAAFFGGKSTFGAQTTYCKPAASGEPHPAAFQIPPGYKPVVPSPPAPPK
jgi:hypothetical protein